MLEIRVTRLGRFGQISVDFWYFYENFVILQCNIFGNLASYNTFDETIEVITEPPPKTDSST